MSSQRKEVKIFFGFPNKETNFIPGDVIITNLPEINYNRGVFISQNNLILDQLISFLQSQENKTFQIKLDRCDIKGNKEYNDNFNKNLSLSLQTYLKKNNIYNGLFNQSDFKNCAGNLIPNKNDNYYSSSGNYLSITVK